MYCSLCGTENAPTNPYCVNCGAAFRSDTPSWREAQRRHAELVAQYERAEIEGDRFQQAHIGLAVRDAAGRTWLPSQDPDRPFLWDGSAWRLQQVTRVAPIAPVVAPRQSATQTRSDSFVAARAQPVIRLAPSQSPPGVYPQATPEPRKRRRWGCCLWPLLALLVLAVAAVWISPLPERWGIRKAPTEKVFGDNPEPDRGVALALEAELNAAGIDTTGLYAYVLPYKDGRTGSVLYTVLDGSAGFRFPEAEGQDPVLACMANLADSPVLAQAGVDRIAVDYRDSSGGQLMVMTAPVSSIQAYARGEISREAFLRELEVQVDLSTLGGEFLP